MTSSFLAGLVLVKHLSVLENPADICTSHTHLGQFRIELGDRHKVLVRDPLKKRLKVSIGLTWINKG